MASNIDPATMMLMETNLGILGPNKYTQFPNGLPWPSSYAGSPTNAYGSPIQGGSSYVNALANPGKVTTPGGYDNSASQPSVLDSFLASNKGGTGAGNYSNQGFFDTLNTLRSGVDPATPAQTAQSEVDARNATHPLAAAETAPMGTTLNTTPAAAAQPSGQRLTPVLQQGDGTDSGGRGAQLATSPGTLIGYMDPISGRPLPMAAGQLPQGMDALTQARMIGPAGMAHLQQAGIAPAGQTFGSTPAASSWGAPQASPAAQPMQGQQLAPQMSVLDQFLSKPWGGGVAGASPGSTGSGTGY